MTTPFFKDTVTALATRLSELLTPGVVLTIGGKPVNHSEYNDVLEKLRDALKANASTNTFQSRVEPWLDACFGPIIAGDKEERNHRFLEEALELVQALGATQSDAHALVDYVYGRPLGEPKQEVGGVMITLATLCLANDLDMNIEGERELARIWTKVEAIRAKQAAKPKFGPLPIETAPYPVPSKPGFYWAIFHTASNMPPQEDWTSDEWGVVEVWDNNGEGEEQFGVCVPGVPVTQWIKNFTWGPEVRR